MSDAGNEIPADLPASGTPPAVAIRRLAVARFASVAGSLAASTALIDLIYRRTDGSTAHLAMTTLCTMGVAGAFAPLGGVVADRWSRKRAMIVSDLTGAALFLAMALARPVWALIALALLGAIASTPFRAASTAAVPSLVRDESQLARANGRLALGSNLGITLGPAIGGLLVEVIDARWVFVLNSVSYLASAAIVRTIHGRFGGVSAGRTAAGIGSDLESRGALAGFTAIRRDRIMFTVTVAWMILLVGMGVGIVADRPIAARFGADGIGFGMMLALYGVGAVAGSWLASRLTAATEPGALAGGLAIAGGAGLGIGLAGNFAAVLACNVAWGIGDATTIVARQGIVQRRTPDSLRGRVAAANDSAAHGALIVGFLAAGPVVGTLGAQGAYAVGGSAALAAAALCTVVMTANRTVTDAPSAKM